MTKRITIAAAAGSMGLCLTAPLLYFTGNLTLEGYRSLLLAASLAWFACSARLAAGFDRNRSAP